MTCLTCEGTGLEWELCSRCNGLGCELCRGLGEVQVRCPDCDEGRDEDLEDDE